MAFPLPQAAGRVVPPLDPAHAALLHGLVAALTKSPFGPPQGGAPVPQGAAKGWSGTVSGSQLAPGERI